MEAKEIAPVQKPILEAIEGLRAPLAAIALLRMADEFYSKEERLALYAEYYALRDAHSATIQRVQETAPSETLSPEKRGEKFSEDVAKKQYADAIEANRAASQRLSAFQREHRLIVRLVEAKAALGKGKYE
jgi:hypothetical protein